MPPSSTPQQTSTSPFVSPPSDSGAGPIIGAIIVVAVLVLGGLYYWGAYLERRDQAAMTAEEILSEPDAVLEQLGTQGTSDELDAIEADVDATDLENLTTELDQI